MKRLLIVTVVVLALGALAFSGNHLLGRALDAQLGPLLTKQLGLPVQLAPIRAALLRLHARSPKLVMGDPQDPAVVATDVVVTLAWRDLLHGKIRLVAASAADLMVRPSRWPSTDGPLPDNYRFLDPWLPQNLFLETGRYVSDSGDSYPVSKLQWRRQADSSAIASWTESRAAGEVSLTANLQSLPDLLDLAPITLATTIEVTGKPESHIALSASVQPGKSAAYELHANIQAASLTAQVTATGQTRWSLPDQSDTSIPLLDVPQVLSMFNSYRDAGGSDSITESLAATLPTLRLPAHRGHVAIDEIRMDDEIGKASAFDFTTGEQGVQITGLTSSGPTGVLNGTLGIVSDAQGWVVDVDATMQAQDPDAGVAVKYSGSDWLWRTGRITLDGRGNTWGALINTLQGDISLKGDFRGTRSFPVALEARLDTRPEEFGLEHLSITLGEGQLTGSASLSETARRKLTLDLQGAHMDLGFLFEPEEAQMPPGIALPEYLGALPDLDLNVTINVEGLQAPGLSLGQAQATLERSAQGGKLVATAKGTDHGTLELDLQATLPADNPGDVQLTANFSELDFPAMFQQQGLFYSRASGSMNFHSQGEGMKAVFAAMQGKSKLAVEIRADNDWKRTSVAQEKLEFSGNAKLVIVNDRIVGVDIAELDIDSIDQDLSGDLSLVAGRTPWLIAVLESEKLDITGLRAMLPSSEKSADDPDLLPSLKRLGSTRVSLNAKSLTLSALPLSDVQFAVASSPDVIDVTQLDFVTEDGTFKSSGKITWKGQIATLESNAQLANIDLDQFLIHSEDVKPVPISGSAKLLSEGSKVDELLGNLTGYIELQADDQQSISTLSRRQLSLKATRLPDGVQADISSLQWGESKLAGSIRYHRTTPPTLEVEIQSGTLSLLPWEKAYLKERANAAQKPRDSTLASAARASADFVGNILLTPLRFLADDDETKPGEKLFSNDPLPLDSLKALDVKLSGTLDSVLSTAIDASKLQFDGSLTNGALALTISSGQLSGGDGDISLSIDSNAAPPAFKLSSTFENVRGLTNQPDTYPRSGFVSLESRGQSQAELASNISGLVYVELGKGPFDYADSTLLTANLATTVFQTLIPGIERQKAELQCGVTVGLLQDGKGVTPYGYAARTNQANLLGHVQVDLDAETIQMKLDSRGRQGVGISVGSLFSNTIQIRGPLSNPRIVPDTTSLALRGWVAFMTGGLSVLGETLFKRVLASENPCDPIKEQIRKDLCPNNLVAASSKMVCPTAP